MGHTILHSNTLAAADPVNYHWGQVSFSARAFSRTR